jgi:hypothetical protein
MIEALRSGHIRHAGLDVFAREPLPAGHVLTTLENVTLSAHSAFPYSGSERQYHRRGARSLPPHRGLASLSASGKDARQRVTVIGLGVVVIVSAIEVLHDGHRVTVIAALGFEPEALV